MTDDVDAVAPDTLDQGDNPDTEAGPQVPAEPRSTSAGAQAASRARRIGGRPLPTTRPSPRPTDADRAEAPSADSSPRSRRVARGTRATTAAGPAPAAGQDVKRRRQAAAPVGAGRRSSTDTERMRRQLEVLRWVPAGVAGVAAVAMLVLCVWQSHGVWWDKPGHDPGSTVRQQVLAAAKPCVAAIVSYDYRNLAASEKAGQACITGSFKNDYTKAMESTVKTLAPQTKTVQVFQVAKAGVETVSADGKQWVVLLYGQQQVTNTSTAKDKPRLDILNVQATLDKVGDKWLVSSIR